MNSDIFKGEWLQLKGRIRRQWGRFTDDELAQINGDRDIFVGRLQALYGRSREEAENELDRFLEAETQTQPR